jgi:hypothetical protein
MWPISAIGGALHWELPLPSHFGSAAELVDEDTVAEEIVCGPDRDRHLAKTREYVEAGYDHVCIHQVGPDQAGFMRFYERDVLPNIDALAKAA